MHMVWKESGKKNKYSEALLNSLNITSGRTHGDSDSDNFSCCFDLLFLLELYGAAGEFE